MPRLVVLLLTALLVLTGCSSDTEIAPPKATGPGAGADAVQRTTDDLAAALRSRDAEAAARLAAPGARPLLEAVVANAQAIGLEVTDLRYLEDTVLAGSEAAPEGTRAVTVELVWRLPGWDARASRAELSLLLDESAEHVVGFQPGAEGRVPVWLTGSVRVARADRALVISASSEPELAAERLLGFARRAVREATQTLGWRGRLVVEAPGSDHDLEDALLAGEGQYASIAGITATVDGSGGRQAPLHVFLNPEVFAKLGGQGAQVVMTHEAVHVATRANASHAPDWLREGFADYVALSHARVPVTKAGAQAIAKVRKDGPPKQLPSDAALAASAPGIGTAYEEAWLVCRFIAREYGEDRLIAFYEAIDQNGRVAEALDRVLGTNEKALVKAWSRDLAQLAR